MSSLPAGRSKAATSGAGLLEGCSDPSLGGDMRDCEVLSPTVAMAAMMFVVGVGSVIGLAAPATHCI